MSAHGELKFDPATLQTFPGISPTAFQHPSDRKATQVIQQLPVFPQMLKALSGGLFEKVERLEKISGSFRLGPTQGRSIYRLFVRAAEILSIQPLPEIYVTGGGMVNAYASGMKKYSITLLSPLVSMMTEEELLAIIAHELGHIKCGHMANKTLGTYLATFGAESIASFLPVLGPLALQSLKVPLAHWSRMAELSCDRAALVVVQDPKIVIEALSKIGGWSKSLLGDLNLEILEEQMAEYDQTDDGTFDGLLKVGHMLDTMLYSHPLTTVRIHKISQWGQSDQFREIMSGGYPRETIRVDASGHPHCISCGQALALGDEFCATCGAPKPHLAAGPKCPNPECGKPIKTGQKFCSKCGQDLTATMTVQSNN